MQKKYKLALSQIVKNEAHVITRMLDSIKPIVDCLVIVDTGSTDNTKEVLENWSKENNIPLYLYERPFDNFENSRNYAMKMVKELSEYAFWLDADEVLDIDTNVFNKEKLDKDLYMFNTHIGAMKYTRNECWKTSKSFRWYGPVHEFIVCDETITSGFMEGLSVRVFMDGGSWKEGDISEKYRKHSVIYEDYLKKDRNARWVFYIAQSYHDSAIVPNNKEENDERLRRAMNYYRERVFRNDGYEEERFYSQFRIGTIKRALEFPWMETKQELLKAYSMDPLRAEPIKVIIDHYLMQGEWSLAYLYSKLAKVNFHMKNPYPKRLLYVDESLYIWKFLEVHTAACFYTGRKEEAAANFKELQEATIKYPNLFTQEDINKINSNKQFFSN